MSTSGVTNGMFSQFEQVQQEFQQLGQDLTAGNLSAAQSDFANLQQDFQQIVSTNTTQNSNPIAEAFTQLAQNLQSGNLSGAQQDYSTLQQDFQNEAARSHHHSQGSGRGEQNQFTQLFQQLGQDLQSGNLPGAQTTFNSLQEFMQSITGQGNGSGSNFPGVSVNA